MSAVTAADASILMFRIGLGAVFLAHGYHHLFGGGKIADTARWFESLGMPRADRYCGPSPLIQLFFRDARRWSASLVHAQAAAG